MLYIIISLITELLLIMYLFSLRKKDKQRLMELEQYIWEKMDKT